MSYELVILDMDGLMFNTESLYFEAWSKALVKMGYEPSPALYRDTMGFKLDDCYKIYAEYYTGLDSAVLDELINRFAGEMFEKGQLLPQKGLLELIDYLDGNGIKKAIASSSPIADIMRNLTLTNIENNFDYIISGADLEKTKPHPEIFIKVCEKLNIPREKTLVLEDSRNGVKAAYNGGIKCIMIPDMIPPDQELEEKSYLILDSLLEVIEYLKDSPLS